MSTLYCLILNSVKKPWAVAAETIKCKRCTPSLAIGIFALAASLLCSAATSVAIDPGALPTGGKIVAGSGTINQAGTAMTINQASQRLIANWSTFNIGQNAGVTFQQPNASAVALNRIQDQNPSQIFGALSANGQVWLLNPSGIVFGPTAKVDVGGLVASSLNITNENFLSGKNLFEKSGTAGAVTNRGSIRTTDGGYLAFMAPIVDNEGSLIARKGTVALVAADKVSLDFSGDRLITYTVDQGAVDALAKNSGLIKADGGLVMMTARAAHDLTGAVVNNSGVIEAQTLENKAGRILLLSDMKYGETVVGGRLDASAPSGGDGGFIETSAAKVTVANNVQITTSAPQGKTGEWLIDPVDITVAAFGGDITGSSIANALKTTNVTLDTTGAGNCTGASCSGPGGSNGDITINDNITTTADLGATRTLTFKADRNITLEGDKKIDATQGGNTKALNVIFNADSNAVNVGGVTLNYNSAVKTNGGNIVMGGGTCTTAGCSAPAYGTGQAGTGGITIDDNDWGPISLSSGNGSIWMWGSAPAAGGAGVHIKNATIDSGAVGSVYLKGTGVYDAGNPQDGNGFGIFIKHATIIAGSGGMTLDGTAADTSSLWGAPPPVAIGFTGTSSAYTTNGGTLTVNANSPAGGLYVGTNWTDDLLGGPSQNGNIILNYTGTGTGGLPNINNPAGDLTVNSLTSGLPITDGGNGQTVSVSGTTSIVANNGSVALGTEGGSTFSTGTLTISGALGISVINTGALTLGALAGGAGPIDVATTTGNLTIGGAISTTNDTAGAITLNAGKDTAAGTATGGNIIVTDGSLSMGAGGRATLYSGSVADSNGLTGLIGSGSGRFRYNSDESATNFTTALGTGNYAVYREQPTVTITANDASKTYNGVAYSGGNGVTANGFVNGDTSASFGGVLTYGGTSQGAVNAGNYVITPSGYTSGLGYATSFVSGALQINPALVTALAVTAESFSKTYGTTYNFTGQEFTSQGLVGGDTIGSVTLTSAGAPATASVGNYSIIPSNATGGTFNPANYIISYVNGILTVTKAALTVTANTAAKTYDGAAYSGGNGVAYSGFVNNENASALGGNLNYGGTSQGAVNAGVYTIIPSGLASANYQIGYVNGALNIDRAPLTVTASTVSKTFGNTYSFTGKEFTSNGLAGAETIGSVTLTSAGVQATAAVTAGGYPIVASDAAGGTFNPANYTISYQNGKLIVNATPVPPLAPPPPVPPTAQPTVTAVTAALTAPSSPAVTGGTGTPGTVAGLSGSNNGVSGSSIAPPTVITGSGTGGVVVSGGGTGAPLAGSGGGFGGAASAQAPASLTPTGSGGFAVVVVAAGAGRNTSGDLIVNQPLANQSVLPGERISFNIPSSAFAHTNPNATVTLTATQANGQPLPAWMTFNPMTGRFEGTPPPGFKNNLSVRVIARDSEGHQATQVMSFVFSSRSEGTPRGN